MTKLGLILSFLFHAALLFLLLGKVLGSSSPAPLFPAKAIPLRALPIKDKTQLASSRKATKNRETKKPKAKKPKSSPAPRSSEKPKATAKSLSTEKKVSKKEKKSHTKAPKKIQKKKPQQPSAKTSQKDLAKKNQKTEEDFLSVMKSVEELPTPSPTSTNPFPQNIEVAEASSVEEFLSLSELDALRQQLSSCWRLPAGARGAENLVINLTVTMNADQTVQKVSLERGANTPSSPYFQIAFESAKRALYHPHCTPLKLPKDKYQQWKSFTISFNPKEMIT